MSGSGGHQVMIEARSSGFPEMAEKGSLKSRESRVKSKLRAECDPG